MTFKSHQLTKILIKLFHCKPSIDKHINLFGGLSEKCFDPNFKDVYVLNRENNNKRCYMLEML